MQFCHFQSAAQAEIPPWFMMCMNIIEIVIMVKIGFDSIGGWINNFQLPIMLFRLNINSVIKTIFHTCEYAKEKIHLNFSLSPYVDPRTYSSIGLHIHIKQNAQSKMFQTQNILLTNSVEINHPFLSWTESIKTFICIEHKSDNRKKQKIVKHVIYVQCVYVTLLTYLWTIFIENW